MFSVLAYYSNRAEIWTRIRNSLTVQNLLSAQPGPQHNGLWMLGCWVLRNRPYCKLTTYLLRLFMFKIKSARFAYPQTCVPPYFLFSKFTINNGRIVIDTVLLSIKFSINGVHTLNVFWCTVQNIFFEFKNLSNFSTKILLFLEWRRF